MGVVWMKLSANVKALMGAQEAVVVGKEFHCNEALVKTDAWARPAISGPDSTGHTRTPKLRKRSPIEWTAMAVAGVAVVWALWVVLFYRR